MAEAEVIFKDGETLTGDVQDKTFTIISEAMGEISVNTADIAWIIFGIYADPNAKDQMMLHDQTQYDGNVLNQQITVKPDDGSQARQVATAQLSTIKFDLED
ncbi:MAG: hypothetical protein ACYCPQ_10520 [Elusimicrobiota bacterium]